MLLFLALIIFISPAVAQQGYILGSGDRVKVTVFGEEDLSGEFELDGQSRFSMPLIGTVSARGASPRSLEERIVVLLRDGFLRNPKVSVEVLNYRPFYILGEINNPGSYPYRAGMTVLNAAAMAGGFTFRADEDDIEVTPGGIGQPRGVNSSAIVQPGDVIRVKESIF
ncbi:MAG: polysaccharide biosynthesis/export family protein [Pseudomonadota bacterium]